VSRRITVAGYGNVLRRDDGVGWLVAAAIAEDWGDRVTVLLAQQPVPEWAATWAESDVVFAIDAALGPEHRQVRMQKLALPTAAATWDGHRFGPEQLLALTEVVYGRVPQAYLVLVPAADTGFGPELSPGTARSALVARNLLNRRIRRWQAPAARGSVRGAPTRRARRETPGERYR
jgi:hydrogenase maturation protease